MLINKYSERRGISRYYFLDPFVGLVIDTYVWEISATGGGWVGMTQGLGGRAIIMAGVTVGDVAYIQQSTSKNFDISTGINAGFKIRILDLTDCIIRFAFLQDSTNTIYIALNTSIGSNWISVCQDGSGSTTVDSGITVNTNWHEVRLNCTAAQCNFLLDGISIATITTHIPVGLFGPQMHAYRVTSGYDYRSCLIDWVEASGGRA